ncbi:MAG: hypothetical protein HYZ48_00340, partial [Chlamydiales bacterium]|nr:hypothetical protein [Chlamydiales bacterium]
LINPKGILFAEGSKIRAASFFASTLDVLDSDFLYQKELSFQGDSKESVINFGKITAWDGDVALIAYHVENHGFLEAPQGVAALAAGRDVLLIPEGNQRIAIRACSLEEIPTEIGVENDGQLIALQIELKADGNPYRFAIKEGGKIDALASEKRGGEIYLIAEKGVLDIEGAYSAANPCGEGGKIHLLGHEVFVQNGTSIDVSGATSGGEVLIGGDYQGKNPNIPNAEKTFVAKEVTISADATQTIIINGPPTTGGVVCPFPDFGALSSVNIDAADLVACLGLGNVTINAANSTSLGTGSITVNADVIWPDPTVLTLQAQDVGSTIQLNALVQSTNTTLSGSSIVIIKGGDLTVGDPLHTQIVPCGIDAASGSVSVTVGKLGIYGGSNATSDAVISAQTGRITVTASDTITLEGGTGDNSNALIQMTQSGGNAATPMTIKGSSDMNLIAGSGMNSSARLSIDQGGTVNSSITGDYTIQGGNGSGDCRAGLFQGEVANQGNIFVSGNNFEVTGGSGTGDCSAQINRSGNGGSSRIELTALGTVTFTGGSSATSGALLLAVHPGGTSTFTSAGDFSFIGGVSAAQIQLGRAAIFDIGGNLKLEGGSAAGGFAQIINTTPNFSNMSFSIGGDLNLLGGTFAGALVQIQSATGPVTFDWKTGTGPTGAVNLQANAAEALIWISSTATDNSIVIGGTTPPSSITLEGGTGATSRAMIYTNQGGSIQASVDGPYTITGGSASVDGRAGFYTGITSSSGNITLSGEQTDPSAAGYAFQLEGGTGTGDNSAEISVERATGSIVLTNSGRLLLQGGAGDDSSARIITQGVGNTGSILITGTGDVSLQGGSGGNPGAVSNAEINAAGSITCQIQNGSYSLTGGDIDTSQALITAVSDVNLRGYDVALTPGMSGVVDGSNAIIESTGDGSRVLVRALNAVSLSGNATPDQKSQIQTTSATGTNPVAISSKILTLQGGSALNSLAEITTQKGPVVLAILNHITMTGGSAMGAHAWV